ncbi:hypothetical protein LZ30DRAFT_94791 [Colletotrichum cereale]|nr:hypothetical protein LZ30DRAFT_94791 [Colletotrichum cereale]
MSTFFPSFLEGVLPSKRTNPTPAAGKRGRERPLRFPLFLTHFSCSLMHLAEFPNSVVDIKTRRYFFIFFFLLLVFTFFKKKFKFCRCPLLVAPFFQRSSETGSANQRPTCTQSGPSWGTGTGTDQAGLEESQLTPNRYKIEPDGLAVDKGFKSAGGRGPWFVLSPSSTKSVQPVCGLEGFLGKFGLYIWTHEQVASPVIETPRYPVVQNTGEESDAQTETESGEGQHTYQNLAPLGWLCPVLDHSTTIPIPAAIATRPSTST